MPDQFTETTTVGYGSRILNSIKGIVVGLILFIASFGVLYWNEGRIDFSTIAKKAVEISAESISRDSSLSGKLISATGILNSNETVGDNLFLKPDKFIAVERKVEMYSWVEKTQSKSQKNVGGSETTETTYNYVKEWTDRPLAPSSFKYPEGHNNPQKTLESSTNKVKNATLGAYKINMSSVELPNLIKLPISQQNINLSQGAILANDTYIFIGKNEGSVFDNPQVGDLRVSYTVLYPGITATIFGKLDKDSISPYFDKNNTRFYRIFSGTRDEAISTLHSEYLMWIWIFRLVGFLMMWFGLSMLFGPISVLLDILPIFGTISRVLINAITLVASLILSIVTILVSMIIHSVVALVIALVIVVALMIAWSVWFKNKKSASQFAPPVALLVISLAMSLFFFVAEANAADLSAPTLISPADESIIASTSEVSAKPLTYVKLSWSDVHGSVSYQLMTYDSSGDNSSTTVSQSNGNIESWSSEKVVVIIGFADDVYQWKVRACNDDVPSDLSCGKWNNNITKLGGNRLSIFIVGQPLTAPQLISPANNAMFPVSTSEVALSWSPVAGASSYSYSASSSYVSNGEEMVHLGGGISNTANKIIDVADKNGQWTWFVIACNMYNFKNVEENNVSTGYGICGPLSEKRVFTIATSTQTSTSIQSQQSQITSTSQLKSGALVKSPSDDTVYVIKDGKKQPISSPQEFEQSGYKWDQIKTVQSDLLKQIADLKAQISQLREELKKTGTLIKNPNGPEVYVIKDGKKEHITSPQEFSQKGYKWDQIKTVTQDEISQIPDFTPGQKAEGIYPNGTLIKAENDQTVYIIVNGKKRPIPDPATFNNWGLKWDQIKEVPASQTREFEDIKVSSDIVRAQGNDKIYRIIGDKKLWIPTVQAFLGSGYKPNSEIDISQDNIADFEDVKYIKVKGGRYVYEIKDNKKYRITDTSQIPAQDIKPVTLAEFIAYPIGK